MELFDWAQLKNYAFEVNLIISLQKIVGSKFSKIFRLFISATKWSSATNLFIFITAIFHMARYSWRIVFSKQEN